MRFVSSSFVPSVAFSALVTVACSSGASSEVDGVASRTDDLTNESVILTSSEADPVRFTVEFVDGAKPETKNARYVKVSAARGGSSGVFYCELRGKSDESEVACMTGIRNLNLDKHNEWLDFSLVKAGGSYRLDRATYSGESGYLYEEAAVILGSLGARELSKPVALVPTTGSATSLEGNPFLLGDAIGTALKPIVGQQIYVSHPAATETIESFDFSVNDRFAMYVSVYTKASGNLLGEEFTLDVSLFNTPGDLSSKLASASVWWTRVQNTIPKAP